MKMPAPTIFAVVLLAVIALLWLLRRFVQRRAVATFSPSNDLERLLDASVGTTEFTREMTEQLSSAVLLALESAEEPGEPMDFSATFPQEICGVA